MNLINLNIKKEITNYNDPNLIKNTKNEDDNNISPNIINNENKKLTPNTSDNNNENINLPQLKSENIIPPLPSFNLMKKEVYRGPTEESNWVIPGHLMLGAYPADVNDKITYRNLGGIMRLGIGTFVCLQQEYDPSPYITETMWRSGFKLRPYYRDVEKIYKDGSLWNRPKSIKPKFIDFIHFPIIDLAASASDSQLLNLCISLCERLDKGEKLYIHCWGGHGRAGTVGSIVVGLLYNLKPSQAMDLIQFTHDMRVCSLGVPSPQTTEQRLQVARILLSPPAQKYISERLGISVRQPEKVESRPNTSLSLYSKHRTPRHINLCVKTNVNKTTPLPYTPSPPQTARRSKSNPRYQFGSGNFGNVKPTPPARKNLNNNNFHNINGKTPRNTETPRRRYIRNTINKEKMNEIQTAVLA